MMTPIDVYNAVAGYNGVFISTICDVKAQCVQYASCSSKSTSSILDFDKTAETYKTEKGLLNTPPTVDAIAIDSSNSLLILIEKKTWGAFFIRPQKGVVGNLQSAALAKIPSYNLQGKYQSTRDICEHITNVPDLFDSLPHVFVFLTELSDEDPTGGFATMMGNLASTSSIVDYQTQKILVGAMTSHLATVSCSNSRYLYCQELDDFIKDPNTFE